jgi:hypothetical protein
MVDQIQSHPLVVEQEVVHLIQVVLVVLVVVVVLHQEVQYILVEHLQQYQLLLHGLDLLLKVVLVVLVSMSLDLGKVAVVAVVLVMLVKLHQIPQAKKQVLVELVFVQQLLDHLILLELLDQTVLEGLKLEDGLVVEVEVKVDPKEQVVVGMEVCNLVDHLLVEEKVENQLQPYMVWVELVAAAVEDNQVFQLHMDKVVQEL